MTRRTLLAAVATVSLVVPVAAAEAIAVADPALSGWIIDRVSEHPDVAAAQAAVTAAQARQRAAGQPLFNPELEFEYERSTVDTTTGGFSQTIDWSGKRGARAAVAGAGAMAAVAELRSRRQALAADLLRVLAAWQTADSIDRISAKQGELMTRFTRLAEQRRQAGDLNQIELELAHLAASEAAFRQANARANLIRAQQAVTAQSGQGHTDWPVPHGTPPELDDGQIDVDRLLADLPALQLARAQVAAARAAIEASRRERRPDPTLGIRAGREDTDTLTGITLSVPLPVRNTYSAEVDAASAELVRAEREAAALERQARADLLAAAGIYRNARQAWTGWEAAGAHRLSQRTELLDRLWQAGELGTTDYLVQLKQALETEVSAAEQYGVLWRAWADWLAASGRFAPWLNLAGDTP